ncbi:MAG: phosphotransferase [Anaerolineae bacterium]|nr:phosphotransferase [Anaerolineae bacterium]
MAEIQRARDALRFWAQRIGPAAGLEAAHQNWAGGEATVWAVTTERGERFILKNVAGGPAVKRIETEYDLLRHLQASGVPVAVPILSDDGQPGVEDQGRIYLLYPLLPVDHDIPPTDIKHVYAHIGAAVARLHKALAVYPGHIDSWTMNLPRAVFEEAIPRIRRVLTGQDAETFQQIVAALQDEMMKALENLPMQYIHGDCHGGNYLLYHGDVSGFVDLDHLPTGPRVYDIGYLLADMAKAQFFNNHAHQGWLDSFHCVIAGYQQENSLSRREKDALWFVMLATQVLFVDWFFGHQKDDLARKNLAAFYWIYGQRDEISRRIAGV